jgi:predicted nucleotidyltransferase|tara:strand:+ start:359 stop:784 length:426 start_codon:yes stop_codon:yes gene_type:complete
MANGIQKECIMCKATFVTRTISSASWQKHCEECQITRKREQHIHRTQSRIENLEESLRSEMKTLSHKVSDIDILISAEISNALSKLTDNDLYEALMASMQKQIDAFMSQIEADNKKFREKMQRQLLTMNNKLVKIMQEMEE